MNKFTPLVKKLSLPTVELQDHAKTQLQEIMPIPADTQLPNMQLKDLELVAVYHYKNAAGKLNMLIGRYHNQQGQKEFRPFTYYYNLQTQQYNWRMSFPNCLYSLYGIDNLAAHPDRQVIFCEGEKCADSVAKLFPDFIGITSACGANGVEKSDFSPLRNRRILIWPDNDQTGIKYAITVKEKALKSGAPSAIILNFI